MSLLAVKSLTKRFEDKKRKKSLLTLDQVNLNVEESEFICLLGPSGCGKSTLLNIIAGFESVSEGDLFTKGVKITGPGDDRGMVFQQATLMPWLTVWENVSFYLKIQKKSKNERKQAAQKYIEMVGLKGFENHYPYELSGGMKQRVGIARALLMDPSIILMDEPFAALDAQTRMTLQEELVRIWQINKKTIIFVTHSVEEALILGTRVVVMSARPGRIRDIIDISDLNRPRDTTSIAFNAHKKTILNIIKEEADHQNSGMEG
ncbi:ABC transporter ATP-binding protein [Sporolactobacillus sp. Y61]|uniref:ABC transporter ATP-binding protein n=1 Tax=Sporolactobacillus sp. Y61 TaxID=3160863 RepID=A0AAU8IH52_9BACL